MSHVKSRLFAVASTMIASLAIASSSLASDYISLNAGSFNALRSDNQSFQYGAEYRFSEVDFGIRPIIGAFGTSDSAAYGYVGLNWDVALIPNQLYIIPNFAVGAFSEGDGKDLGGTLQFRSGIELAYQFPNAHQIGVALNHLSNAGIYKKNPGEETIMVTYSLPVSAVSGMLSR
jgi:lipid A 3-O-deacylase